MNRFTAHAIATAIALSFSVAAAAQTTQPRGNSKEQPSPQPPVTSAPSTTMTGKTRASVNADYRTALKACTGMARADRSKCRSDARATRKTALADVRGPRMATAQPPKSGKIEQGK